MSTRPPSPRRRGHLRALVVGVAAVVVLASCGSWNPDVDTRSATQGLPETKVDLVVNAWRLDAAASTPRLTSATAGGGGREVTVDFHTDGTASGRAPCNTFHATVDYGDGSVTVTDIVSTLLGCEKAVMDDDRTFHDALRAVESVTFSADHDTLTLTGPGGVHLVFDSYDPHH